MSSFNSKTCETILYARKMPAIDRPNQDIPGTADFRDSFSLRHYRYLLAAYKNSMNILFPDFSSGVKGLM